MHRISDIRMGGVSTRNLRMFRKLCGDDTLKNVVIVTSMWGKIAREEGRVREKELASDDKFFKPILDQGGRMLRHYNTEKSARSILKSLIRNRPKALDIQVQLVDRGMNLEQTAAGEELQRELLEQKKRLLRELEDTKEEMRQAIEEHDFRSKKELEDAQNQLKWEIERVEGNSRDMESRFREERARLEQEFAERARRDEEMIEEHRRQIREYEDRLRDAHASQSEKENMGREIAGMRQEIERLSRDRGGGCVVQ
jgi:chromosome segregation ATPase